jgi:glycosyl transferase family 2
LVSDQSLRAPADDAPAVQAMIRVLESQGRAVRIAQHLPRRGLAEQREALLQRSSADRVLYLDDDVWLAPGAVPMLMTALTERGGGFVGMAPQGLSFLDDVRPQEHMPFERWTGPVEPERVRPGTEAFERWRLHNAANLVHIAAAQQASRDAPVAYRVAWVGACVLYDRAALVEAGGYDFWQDLPAEHAGEDVVVQWRILERRGGAGLLPSLAVHLESPTTIPARDADAVAVVFGRHPVPSA